MGGKGTLAAGRSPCSSKVQNHAIPPSKSQIAITQHRDATVTRAESVAAVTYDIERAAFLRFDRGVRTPIRKPRMLPQDSFAARDRPTCTLLAYEQLVADESPELFGRVGLNTLWFHKSRAADHPLSRQTTNIRCTGGVCWSRNGDRQSRQTKRPFHIRTHSRLVTDRPNVRNGSKADTHRC